MHDIFNQDLTEILMPIDENTGRELRGRLERAMDGYNDLNVTVTRIEERFTALERHIGERLGDIAGSLKNLTLVSDEMRDLRHTMELKRIEHEDLRRKETSHQEAIDRISEQLKTIGLLEQRIKVNDRNAYIILSALITIFLAVLSHIFYGR